MKVTLALLALLAATSVFADANLICYKICKYDMECMDRCLELAPIQGPLTDSNDNVTMPDDGDDDGSYANSGNPDDTGSEFDGGNNSGGSSSWEDYSGPAYF